MLISYTHVVLRSRIPGALPSCLLCIQTDTNRINAYAGRLVYSYCRETEWDLGYCSFGVDRTGSRDTSSCLIVASHCGASHRDGLSVFPVYLCLYASGCLRLCLPVFVRVVSVSVCASLCLCVCLYGLRQSVLCLCASVSDCLSLLASVSVTNDTDSSFIIYTWTTVWTSRRSLFSIMNQAQYKIKQ
jgi:hypothetical protein